MVEPRVVIDFGVLGPVIAADGSGDPVNLRGPRHREVLARLIVARGRVVPLNAITDDLWDGGAPPGAVSAVRTFVAALRRALEPDRTPRSAPTLIRTAGLGYALTLEPDAVDAWRFEDALTTTLGMSLDDRVEALDTALGWWRGPAYADFADRPWTRGECVRLTEMRLTAVENLADAQLATGRAATAIGSLDEHVTLHPWREEAWRMLALGLYRTERQGDALAVLRTARVRLADDLGIDPGPRLTDLESAILRRDDDLNPHVPVHGNRGMWSRATSAYDRAVTPNAGARLESTVGLLRGLAVTGGPGLTAARAQRLSTITAAEQTGDVELVARTIGGYDVPGIWSRSDDPAQAVAIVAAAQRTLAALPDERHPSARVRLLTAIAIESRGIGDGVGRSAALDAVASARRLGDPSLLASALGGLFLQTFHRTGLAVERGRIGREIVEIARRHDLVNLEVLGLLINLQSDSATGKFDSADVTATTIDDVAQRHERPLATVFTTWYRAMRAAAATTDLASADNHYRCAAAELVDAGMPGVEAGLLPLAMLCFRVSLGRSIDVPDDTDFGPYAPWVRPHLLLSANLRTEAAQALSRLSAPPPDHLLEALWCLTARAAVEVGDREMMIRARSALAPAIDEIAGAGSGMLTAGPVRAYLDELDRALR